MSYTTHKTCKFSHRDCKL